MATAYFRKVVYMKRTKDSGSHDAALQLTMTFQKRSLNGASGDQTEECRYCPSVSSCS